jgi:hypothetical protein
MVAGVHTMGERNGERGFAIFRVVVGTFDVGCEAGEC